MLFPTRSPGITRASMKRPMSSFEILIEKPSKNSSNRRDGPRVVTLTIVATSESQNKESERHSFA